MLLGTSTRVTAPADGRNQSVPLTCLSWVGLSSYPFTLVINDDMLFSKFNYILFSETIGYVICVYAFRSAQFTQNRLNWNQVIGYRSSELAG